MQPEGISFRRWKSGDVIGYTKLAPEFKAMFGAPYYVVHRAHIHSALHKLAISLGVDVQLNSKVLDCDTDAPSITLENGRILTSDLIVSADGTSRIILH